MQSACVASSDDDDDDGDGDDLAATRQLSNSAARPNETAISISNFASIGKAQIQF